MDSKGQDLLSTIQSCAQGSIAKGTNGKNYILTGDNKWILYSPAIAGGSSDGNVTDENGIEFIYEDGTVIEGAQVVIEKV